MATPPDPAEAWAVSSSRSFYNSPAYADFSLKQGNQIQHFVGGGISLPYARPVVWTYWRNTRIPVPPPLGPKHSIYYGLIMPKSGYSISGLLSDVKRRRATTFFPQLSFVQPVLLDSGPAGFLDEFIAAIKDEGLKTDAQTFTRVISMPKAGMFEASAALSDERVRALPEYQTILASYSKKRRYDVRRAQQMGVTVDIQRIESDEQAREVYSSVMDLHRESWTRTGLGPHSLEYWIGYSRAMRNAGGHDIVVRAHSDEGELLSVVDVHVLGKSTYYQMNSSSLLGQKLGANPLSLHSAITAAGAWGAEYFELGRYSEGATDKAKSVYAYKAEYGGEVLPVPNFSMGG